MLVENQFFEKKWQKNTKEWYENKGYVFTKKSDKFMVRAEDLSPGAKAVVKVKCDLCGKIVDVVWRDYYVKYVKGGDNCYSCEKCRQQKTSDNNKEKRIERQYKRALEVCNKKNYKIITPINRIDKYNSFIEYICPKHGLQKSKMHLLGIGHGCVECGYEQSSQASAISIEEVNRRFNKYGGVVVNVEDYTSCMKKNMLVVCNECGGIFPTSLYAFTKHHGQRCPDCSQSKTNGEFKICNFLDTYGIKYNYQHKFDDCKFKNTLLFDFYIPDINTIIEYDGEFHYIPIQIDGKSIEVAEQRLNETKQRDQIKNEYCKTHNINLLRIPYWDFDNIEYILYNQLID